MNRLEERQRTTKSKESNGLGSLQGDLLEIIVFGNKFNQNGYFTRGPIKHIKS